MSVLATRPSRAPAVPLLLGGSGRARPLPLPERRLPALLCLRPCSGGCRRPVCPPCVEGA